MVQVVRRSNCYGRDLLTPAEGWAVGRCEIRVASAMSSNFELLLGKDDIIASPGCAALSLRIRRCCVVGHETVVVVRVATSPPCLVALDARLFDPPLLCCLDATSLVVSAASLSSHGC